MLPRAHDYFHSPAPSLHSSLSIPHVLILIPSIFNLRTAPMICHVALPPNELTVSSVVLFTLTIKSKLDFMPSKRHPKSKPFFLSLFSFFSFSKIIYSNLLIFIYLLPSLNRHYLSLFFSMLSLHFYAWQPISTSTVIRMYVCLAFSNVIFSFFFL